MRLFTMIVLLTAVTTADAGWFGKRNRRGGGCSDCGPQQVQRQGGYAVQQQQTTYCQNGVCVAPQPQAQAAPVPQAPPVTTEVEIKEKKNKTVIKVRTTSAALDQLNQQRAQRGLRPYLFDESLTRAAEKCANIRAANRIHGHLNGGMSDFACIDDGTSCSATGAGALEPSWGFATCCMYENYTYAGAAAVMGPDGRQYCSLFVR